MPLPEMNVKLFYGCCSSPQALFRNQSMPYRLFHTFPAKNPAVTLPIVAAEPPHQILPHPACSAHFVDQAVAFRFTFLQNHRAVDEMIGLADQVRRKQDRLTVEQADRNHSLLPIFRICLPAEPGAVSLASPPGLPSAAPLPAAESPPAGSQSPAAQ